MKKILFLLLSLVFSTILLAQTEDCDNFNSFAVSPSWASDVTCPVDPPILGNWQAREAYLKYDNFQSIGGASDIYLRIRDDYSDCLSWIYNGVDYTGDWSEIGDCFCYDFNFFSSTGAPAPASLIHIYAGSSDLFSATHIAEFVLYDEISASDGWVNICPPLFLSSSGLPTNEFGYWKMDAPFDGGVADWNYLLQNVSGIAFFVDISSGIELYGIDNICFKNDCPPSQELEPPFCCPGENLISNGSFESGNTGFTSEYMYQSVISANSVIPGQYAITNGGEASTISSIWSSIQEPNFCTNADGKFLIVNGENGGGDIPLPLSNSIPSEKVIWEQTVSVEDWKGYKFCMRAKNLNQCGFNITPKLKVKFSMPVGDISQTVSAPSSACDWIDITKSMDLWGYGTSLNIKVILDQTEFGDGNDVAIDDISLIQLQQCSDASAEFDYTTITPHPTNSSYFSVVATADIVPPCNAFWWEVCRLDLSTLDCDAATKLNGIWWTNPTNFPGYVGTTTQTGSDPGYFEYSTFDNPKIYRITRGTWGDCNSWNQSSKYVGAPMGSKKIYSYTEKEFKANKEKIIKLIRGNRRN